MDMKTDVLCSNLYQQGANLTYYIISNGKIISHFYQSLNRLSFAFWCSFNHCNKQKLSCHHIAATKIACGDHNNSDWPTLADCCLVGGGDYKQCDYWHNP